MRPATIGVRASGCVMSMPPLRCAPCSHTAAAQRHFRHSATSVAPGALATPSRTSSIAVKHLLQDARFCKSPPKPCRFAAPRLAPRAPSGPPSAAQVPLPRSRQGWAGVPERSGAPAAAAAPLLHSASPNSPCHGPCAPPTYPQLPRRRRSTGHCARPRHPAGPSFPLCVRQRAALGRTQSSPGWTWRRLWRRRARAARARRTTAWRRRLGRTCTSTSRAGTCACGSSASVGVGGPPVFAGSSGGAEAGRLGRNWRAAAPEARLLCLLVC